MSESGLPSQFSTDCGSEMTQLFSAQRSGPVRSGPSPGPLFGQTEDWTGLRNSQNQKTADWDHKKLVCGGPGLNVLKSGLNPQKHRIYCENKLYPNILRKF